MFISKNCMTDTQKLESLRQVLFEQLVQYKKWLEEGKDEDYIYDRACDLFDGLSRGSFDSILSILSE